MKSPCLCHRINAVGARFKTKALSRNSLSTGLALVMGAGLVFGVLSGLHVSRAGEVISPKQAPASSHLALQDYVLTPKQQQVLLPDEVREALGSVLKTVPWQESRLLRTPSLLFTSGQSLGPDNERVLNRVHLFPRGRFDVWLMKQSIAGHAKDLRHWNRVAIVVDRKIRPFRAYYFQFGTESSNEQGVPRPKAFTAACLTCHSSGPRMIRPEATQWTKTITREDLKRLKDWNWRISGYREVIDYSPKWGKQFILELNEPSQRETLALKSCVDCHRAGSGVRSPLMRQHADSIEYLVRHHADARGFMSSPETRDRAEMPMEVPALSTAEKNGLSRWLKGD